MPLDRNDTDRQYYLSLTVQTYSEKTVAALREDYAIDPVPYGTNLPADEGLLALGVGFPAVAQKKPPGAALVMVFPPHESTAERRGSTCRASTPKSGGIAVVPR